MFLKVFHHAAIRVRELRVIGQRGLGRDRRRNGIHNDLLGSFYHQRSGEIDGVFKSAAIAERVGATRLAARAVRLGLPDLPQTPNSGRCREPSGTSESGEPSRTY